MMKCPYCEEITRQVKSGRTEAGSQRMKCQHCQRRYTPNAKEQGYPETLRQQAVKMAVDGVNYRRIGRLLGIDHKTVMLWVRVHSASLPAAPLPSEVVVAEQDELFTFVGKKKTKS